MEDRYSPQGNMVTLESELILSLLPEKILSKRLRMARTEEDMRLRDKANIATALKRTDWKIYGPGGAAELLGIKPTTLLSRIKKMGD